MSSFDERPDIPRTRDGAPNWAADTDPVGPVTPELALVDPGLTRGEINNEVTMSQTQFGDGTNLGATEAPLGIQPLAPLAPLQPLSAPDVAPPAATPVPAPAPVAPLTPEAPLAAPSEPSPSMAIADMRDVPLGTLVFRAGLLPEERLEEALQEGMKTGKRLGEILLERQWVSENDLGRLLAGQKGLPFVELDPAAVDPTAATLLPQEKARLHGALPIGFENGVPVVAVADPSNDLVVENVRRALNCEPVLIVAGRDALLGAINHVYGGAPAPEPVPAAAPEPEPEVVAPAPVEPQPAPVVETVVPAVVAPAAVEPAPPTVEPAAVVPTVEPVAAPVAEPSAPVAEPPAPVAEPPAPAEPLAHAAEPLAPPTVQPAAFVPEPVAPIQNGDGLWLGDQPAVVEQVASAVPAQPEPLQPPEPVQAVQPEPLQAASPPVAQPEPTPEAPPVVAPVPQPEPQPEAQAEPSWGVVLRLANDERLELGAFAGEAEALEYARGVVAQVSSQDGWPFVAGRFVRPDAIVSVDLVELELDRWLGSSARAAALGSHPAP